MNNIDLTIGNNINLGIIDFPINIEKAQQWNIEIKLKGTKYKNNWPIWVYPPSRGTIQRIYSYYLV